MAVALAELSMASPLLQEVILHARAPARRPRAQLEGDWHALGEPLARGWEPRSLAVAGRSQPEGVEVEPSTGAGGAECPTGGGEIHFL